MTEQIMDGIIVLCVVVVAGCVVTLVLMAAGVI